MSSARPRPLQARLPRLRMAAALTGLLVVGTGCGGDEEAAAGSTDALAPTRTPSPAPFRSTAEAVQRRAPEPPPLPTRPSRTELANGLVIEIVTPGEGRTEARTGDRLSIHYDAWLATDADVEEASVVETTHALGIPFVFRLGEGSVVRGLERGLQGAREGDQLRLFVPAALAYGERSVGDVPSGADLIFDVRLLRIAE